MHPMAWEGNENVLVVRCKESIEKHQSYIHKLYFTLDCKAVGTDRCSTEYL